MNKLTKVFSLVLAVILALSLISSALIILANA